MPTTRSLTNLFCDLYSVYMSGQKYPVAYGRDGKIFMRVIELYGDTSEDLVMNFFKFWKSGHKKWVSDGAPTPRLFLASIPDMQLWKMSQQKKEEVLR